MSDRYRVFATRKKRYTDPADLSLMRATGLGELGFAPAEASWFTSSRIARSG